MNRESIRALAKKYLKAGKPLEWFEELYASVGFEAIDAIPWADKEPNPNLTGLVEERFDKPLKTLVVGCGLGDDAEYLSRCGHRVSAFDISESAVKYCKTRFPDSEVNYFVADLLNFPSGEKYDLVVEAYTLQALPLDFRAEAIRQLFGCLSEDGFLLIICRGRNNEEKIELMPIPLAREEFRFLDQRLGIVSDEDYMDREDPPVRRFRLLYQGGRSR